MKLFVLVDTENAATVLGVFSSYHKAYQADQLLPTDIQAETEIYELELDQLTVTT